MAKKPTKFVGGDHARAEAIAKMLDENPKTRPGDNAAALLQAAYDAGSGGLRSHYLARAQREIARLDPQRHGATIQRLQAQVLALQGRGGDTQIAHVAPGEVVIPRSLMTPALMEALTRTALKLGIDPASLQIGSGRNVINPNTGMPQFDEEDLEDQAQAGMGAGSDASDEEDDAAPLPTNPHDLAQYIADKLDEQSPDSGQNGQPSAPPTPSAPSTFTGDATFYNLPGNKTASGQLFDPNARAAAMYQPGKVNLGDTVTVQLQNPPHTSITVPINDTGPFLRGADGKAIHPLQSDPRNIIDLTPQAFTDLAGDTKLGRVPVIVTLNPKSGGR
jgi:hypothetical protein